MTTLSLFLDIAGRVTKESQIDSYFTVASVIIPTADVKKVRTRLGDNLPKWRNATSESLSLVADCVSEYSVASTVVKIEKKQPAWGKFCEKASEYHGYLTKTLNEKVGFAKPGNVLKRRILGLGAATGLGLHIRYHGRPELFDQDGLNMLRLEITCDSDIQGTENRETFKTFWEKWAKSPRLPHDLLIRAYIDRVEFKTEEDEPVLQLPDYLAGHIQFSNNPKKVTFSEHLLINNIRSFEKELKRIKTYKVINRPFNEIYPNLVKKDYQGLCS